MNTASPSEKLSWRDPDGFIVNCQGRILRAVAAGKADQTRALIRSQWMIRLIDQGAIPDTKEALDPPPLEDACGQWLWLQHRRLGFPCYPHEITALQLYDSGQLTLDIAIEAAKNGWTLTEAVRCSSTSSHLIGTHRPGRGSPMGNSSGIFYCHYYCTANCR
jgi:hypothetical protein